MGNCVGSSKPGFRMPEAHKFKSVGKHSYYWSSWEIVLPSSYDLYRPCFKDISKLG